MPIPIIGPIIGGVVSGLIRYFSNGGTGHKVGTAVADFGAIAAIAPAVIWLVTHKDEAALCFTWGQLAVAGAFVFAVIKIAHYTRAGNPQNRSADNPLDFTGR